MYPLKLAESTLQALRRESQALATLPYEATCALHTWPRPPGSSSLLMLT
jgi:hypothetical protein